MVKEQTGQLEEEQAHLDQILNDMLPKYVFNTLTIRLFFLLLSAWEESVFLFSVTHQKSHRR